MGNIAVRPASTADGPAIARVQHETWQATYAEWIPNVVAGLDLSKTADNWSRAAKQPHERVTVAIKDNIIIGYAWSQPIDAVTTELAALYVLPDAQGHGAGSALITDALGWSQTAWIVWALERYAPARAFYEKHGFHLGTQPPRPWRGLPELCYCRDSTGDLR